MSTKITIMSVKASTRPKSPATSAMGRISGSVIWNRRREKPAPSTWAASWMSCGIDVRPAMRITVASGRIRHTWMVMTEPMASQGTPSHMYQPAGPMSPRASSVQLITL